MADKSSRTLDIPFDFAVANAGLLLQLGTAIVVHEDRIDVSLQASALAQLLDLGSIQIDAKRRIEISMAVTLKRRGHELRLVYAAPDSNPAKRVFSLVAMIDVYARIMSLPRRA